MFNAVFNRKSSNSHVCVMNSFKSSYKHMSTCPANNAQRRGTFVNPRVSTHSCRTESIYGVNIKGRFHSHILQFRNDNVELLTKVQFRLPKLTFYGHDLHQSGVSPSEEKVRAIKDTKAPQNPTEVRSFPGLVQYSLYFKFIPNLATISDKFVWGRQQIVAFEKLS